MPKSREDRLQETSASPRGPYVTAKEVGVTLQVPAQLIRRLAQRGAIPAVRVGKLYRFKLDAVLAALERPRQVRTAQYEQHRLRLMRLTRDAPGGRPV